jgi:hypothetical protein
VNGDLVLNGGTLDVGVAGHPVSIGGDLRRHGGVFAHRTGAVTFDGSGVQVLDTDAFTFHDLGVGEGVTLTTVAEAGFLGVLDNLGATQETKEVTGTGAVDFGLAEIQIEVTVQGSLSSLQVTRVDRDHPHAVMRPHTMYTGRYWGVLATGGEYTTSLTLPHEDVADPRVCRYEGGWECAVSAATSTTVTLVDITAFSDWALGMQPFKVYLPLVLRNYP